MYLKFLLQDVKRGIFNIGFVAGVCGLGALFAYNFVTESIGAGSVYFAIVNILAASGFMPFRPVFPVLGYSSSFCEEYESGYYRMILARMKPLKYAQARIISVALSGGIIVAIPYLLVCLAAIRCGVPEITSNTLRVDADLEMVVIAQTYGVGVMVAAKVSLGFLFGAAWALVGLAFAVWMPNKYVSLIAPFVLYQSLWILLDKSILNPARLVNGDGIGHLLSVVMECVWIFAAAAVAMAGFKRRCRDE